jgi:ABC-type transport system involved in multi-copper enzyme maturation permease subunit
MFVGPVFTRELAIMPRHTGLYVARAGYVAALTILILTAWFVVTGTQIVSDVGDMARFGSTVFQILASLQLALAVFFSALLAASAVAEEKDRQTFTLLLLTNLYNSELVLGGLLASLLGLLVLLAAALPLFMLTALLGGMGFDQIGRVFAVTLMSALVCGSLGSTLALWREKTFQALAMTMLILVLWLGAWEVAAAGLLGREWLGISTRHWAVAFSPWQALLAATRPYLRPEPALGMFGTSVHAFLAVAAGLTLAINGLAIGMIRRWNATPDAPRTARDPEAGHRPSSGSDKGSFADDAAAAPQSRSESAGCGRTRPVWDNPVLWREVRTWAYGRRTLVIRLAYLLLFGVVAAYVDHLTRGNPPITRFQISITLVPLFLLSLVLVNAQAVTSLTSERDAGALELLLVTDLTPIEIVFGKLGGVFYNTKEMVVLPLLLVGYLWVSGAMHLENLLYLAGGVAVLYLFVATLGIHVGMIYGNSRTAIGVSLGTVFFLFLGVATCIRMMVAFSGSFQSQLPPFLAFMLGGGLGMYVALGVRNPSTAIGVAAFICPIATFYAITSFFMNYTLAVFLVGAAAYGFTTAAMLIPAIYEFDVATGRAAIGEK